MLGIGNSGACAAAGVRGSSFTAGDLSLNLNLKCHLSSFQCPPCPQRRLARTGRSFYFGGMRSTVLLAGLLLSIGSITDGGQDSPAAIAEREEARDRNQRMAAKIEDLETALQKHQQKIIEMEILVKNLRDEISRFKDSSNNSSTRDAIDRLDKKVDTIDRQRVAEQENVTRELARLRKDLLGAVSSPGKPTGTKSRNSEGPSTTPTPPAGSSGGTEKGFEYEIKDGDRLGKLVIALNSQGHKVTQKQLMDANPKVQWEKLRIGQKIFIPAASSQ